MRTVRATNVPQAVAGMVALLCIFVGILAIGTAADAIAGVDYTNDALMEVACPSVSQCTAVDGGGREVTFNPTAPGSPTPTTIDPSGDLVAVACPSVAQCTAVDGGGREVTFNPTAPGTPTPTTIDPSGGGIWAVACPSVLQCTAVDKGGLEVTFNPTAPSTPTPTTIDPSGDLVAVACPSVLQCTAVDGGGREVTFNPTAPGTPTPTTIDPSGDLVAVACPSVARCSAVERNGREVTFAPTATGGTSIAIVDEPSFCGEHCPEAQLTSVACPSVAQCTAVDTHDAAVTFDPMALGSPKPTGLEGGAGFPVIFYGEGDAVACPSVAQCTAIERWGNPTAAEHNEEWEVTFNPAAPGNQTSAVIEAASLESTSTTTPTTTPTTTTSRGIAEAAGSASVKGGVASIKLTCTGSGACKGTVNLLVRIANKRAQTVAIGRATFSIARGASMVVRVHLSRRGAAAVLKAGKRGLKVKVAGSDIRTRSLVLKWSKPQARKSRHGQRR